MISQYHLLQPRNVSSHATCLLLPPAARKCVCVGGGEAQRHLEQCPCPPTPAQSEADPSLSMALPETEHHGQSRG